MPSASDRIEFAPPRQPGLLGGFLLALLAHLMLAGGLTVALQWKRSSQDVAAEAELWSSVPQQAAPKEVVAPPPPPAQVAPEPPKPQPAQRDADIAQEQEKRKEAEARRQAELERERERKEKLEAQRKQDELRKQEQQRLAAENRRKDEAEKKAKRELEELRLAKMREDNMRRIQGMAGATGGETDRGSATHSSGPSASWAGRVRARVKPNIVFTDDVAGNPKAEVEVRLAPDGMILAKRLVRSSGNRGWDEAVLRALDKTEVLPRDTDGRAPTPVILEFRPRD